MARTIAKYLARPQFVEKEDGKEQSALILRDVALAPGSYAVKVTTPARAAN